MVDWDAKEKRKMYLSIDEVEDELEKFKSRLATVLLSRIICNYKSKPMPNPSDRDIVSAQKASRESELFNPIPEAIHYDLKKEPKYRFRSQLKREYLDGKGRLWENKKVFFNQYCCDEYNQEYEIGAMRLGVSVSRCISTNEFSLSLVIGNSDYNCHMGQQFNDAVNIHPDDYLNSEETIEKIEFIRGFIWIWDIS